MLEFRDDNEGRACAKWSVGVEVGKSVKGCEQPKVPFHVVQCGAELSACSRVLVTN